jgi:cysteine synthase A
MLVYNSSFLLLGCNIYGKAEFLSIGGSVKDRAGAWMVAAGEREGILKPDTECVILESTAGNTGIGLTLAARARGYLTLIVMPDTQTEEKKAILRNCGAHLIEVPAVPCTSRDSFATDHTLSLHS